MEFGVWSMEYGVWSAECREWSGFPEGKTAEKLLRMGETALKKKASETA